MLVSLRRDRRHASGPVLPKWLARRADRGSDVREALVQTSDLGERGRLGVRQAERVLQLGAALMQELAAAAACARRAVVSILSAQ